MHGFTRTYNFIIFFTLSMHNSYSMFKSATFLHAQKNLTTQSKISLIPIPALSKTEIAHCVQRVRRIKTLLGVPTNGLSDTVIACIVENYRNKELLNTLAIDSSSDVHKVFSKIKKDFGIRENILLVQAFNRDTSKNEEDLGVGYIPYICAIHLHKKFFQTHFSFQVHTLAHELEHHRQCESYPDSYYIDMDEETDAELVDLFMEQAADIAACNYITCPYCFKEIKQQRLEHEVVLTDLGPLTTKKGYLSRRDIQGYEQQAFKSGQICRGHKKELKNKSTDLADFLPDKK